jgi:hypothetical protein
MSPDAAATGAACVVAGGVLPVCACRRGFKESVTAAAAISATTMMMLASFFITLSFS